MVRLWEDSCGSGFNGCAFRLKSLIVVYLQKDRAAKKGSLECERDLKKLEKEKKQKKLDEEKRRKEIEKRQKDMEEYKKKLNEKCKINKIGGGKK